MHHMNFIIIRKGVMRTGSSRIDFSKVKTFENLPVFGGGIAA